MEIIIGERSRALSRNKSKNHVKFRCSVMTFDHATEKGLCSRCSPSDDSMIVCVVRLYRVGDMNKRLEIKREVKANFQFRVASSFRILFISISI